MHIAFQIILCLEDPSSFSQLSSFTAANKGFLSIKCWRKVVAGKRFVTANFAVGRSQSKKVQWTTLTNHRDHSFILSQQRKGTIFQNIICNKVFIKENWVLGG